MYSHFRHSSAPGLDKLWIVTPVSNPVRYRSRYDLYQRFKTGVERVGGNLFTVELALGDRPFEVTEAGNPHNLQLRSWTEIWHKEQLINLAIQRLPDDWEYVAWIDSDLEFVRHDWLEETVHQLQRYKIIQMFQTAMDLGPNGEALKISEGFVWAWMNHKEMGYSKKYGATYHPGYSWAARREAIDELGGLLDFAILGAGDHHMALSLIGMVDKGVSKKMSPAYLKHLNIWQNRANEHIRQDIGYMPGNIVHHWHGSKRNRKYTERWEILLRNNYDPELDLKKDWQGLYQFSDAGLRMRNDIREYFNSRSEDSFEL